MVDPSDTKKRTSDAKGTGQYRSLEGIRWLQMLLADLSCQWYMIGGWAIDIHLGYQNRAHEDFEFSIDRQNQEILFQYLNSQEIEMDYIIPGNEITEEYEIKSWQGEWLDPPIHQLRSKNHEPEFDVMLSPHDDNNWLFRRDPQIKRAIDLAILTRNINSKTIQYLGPEIMLLFKAKYKRNKDQVDFEAILPLLSPDQLVWLRLSLEHHYGSGDQWLNIIRD
jgi:hypothetical protein